MNADRMYEFFERAGYRVARTPSADWYVPGDRVYKNFPYGTAVVPSRGEVARLCRQGGVIGVEFHNDSGVGVASGIWVMRDPSYGLHSLQRQFRQRLLRTLEIEEVRPVGFDELFERGAAANRESLVRLRYTDRHLSHPAMWRRLCAAGEKTPGAGAFASFGPRGLTSYLVYFIVGDTCYGLISKSLDAARASGSNNALYFTYTQTMIRRPGISAVAIGAQVVPPLAGLDRIKRHAGYRLQACHVAVFLRPAARALVASAAGGLAMRIGARLLGPSSALERAQALRTMVRATDEGAHVLNAERSS
ncbi:MAG: hypothetical protein ACXW20_13610 [Burkholderiales bacterium]